MARITEQEMFAPFIGKPLSKNYANLTWHEYEEALILYNYEWMDNPILRQQFGLTDRLHEDWLYRGVEYALHLSVDDGKVLGCFVEKIRQGDCGHFKPNIHVLSPTLQELRIARRVLEYITQN
jgi:hypothetical protein